MKHLHYFTLLIIVILIVTGCQIKPESVKNNAKPVKPPTENKSDQQATPVPSSQAKEGENQTDSTPISQSWYFMRNGQHLAPVINKDVSVLLTKNQAVYVIPNVDKKIYLSFDCGYELGYTPAILNTLQQKQIKAAFFITGHYMQSQPELVKRMQAEGHLVCNHTWNHPDLSTIKQEKLQQEVCLLENRYQELTGVPMDKYLRPPMGNYSVNSLKWASDLGYTTVFWSMAWKDWDPQQQPGADYVYQHVMNNIHPGAIILMHTVSSSDTEALEKIITDLQSQGYIFSSFNS